MSKHREKLTAQILIAVSILVAIFGTLNFVTDFFDWNHPNLIAVVIGFAAFFVQAFFWGLAFFPLFWPKRPYFKVIAPSAGLLSLLVCQFFLHILAAIHLD